MTSRAPIRSGPGGLAGPPYVGPQTASRGYGALNVAPHAYTTRLALTAPVGQQVVLLSAAVSAGRSAAAATPGHVEATHQETGNYWLIGLKSRLDTVGVPVAVASPYQLRLKSGGVAYDLWAVTVDFSSGGTIDYMLSQVYAQILL